jgi:hypothetical protein
MLYDQCLTGHSSISFVWNCRIWSSTSPFFCKTNVISTLSAMVILLSLWSITSLPMPKTISHSRIGSVFCVSDLGVLRSIHKISYQRIEHPWVSLLSPFPCCELLDESTICTLLEAVLFDVLMHRHEICSSMCVFCTGEIVYPIRLILGLADH